ncbi:MAG: hypothetical protein AB8B79_02670 [Granulosicoccus sp.]
MKVVPNSARLVLTLFVLLLSACEGESQLFEEAVEVRNLQITALSVTPPANFRDEIFLNTTEQIQFAVQGARANGESIALSATGRRWFVSDTNVAGIDANGLLTAREDGEVSVFVQIGDLVTLIPYTLEVQNRVLESIELIEGPASIERCLPQVYTAVGQFEGGTLRNLQSVQWSIGDTTDARVDTNEDATATVTGLNFGAVILDASVGAITATAPASIEIQDTLTELDISPSPARVDVNESQAFIVTGTYNDEAATDTTPAVGTRRVTITESVDWSITSGTANATVSNEAPDKGTVTGVASGNAVLSARCGDLADIQTVVISSADNDESEQLSFNTTDNPLRIARNNTAGFRLRVSTGSTFTTGNEVTDEVSWNIESLATTTVPISLLEDGVNAGLIRPIAIGDANVTATLDDQSITIRVSVVTP